MRYWAAQLSIFIMTGIAARLILGETSEPNWAQTLPYISVAAIPLILSLKRWRILVPLSYAILLWCGGLYIKISNPDLSASSYLISAVCFYVSLAGLCLLCRGDDESNDNFIMAGLSVGVASYAGILMLAGLVIIPWLLQFGFNLTFFALITYTGYLLVDKGGERDKEAAPTNSEQYQEHESAA